MITTQDLNEAAAASVRGLAIMINADWSKPAGDLEWTCRRTVDHISDALMFYSVQLATRASVRVARARSGDAGADIGGLLGAIEGTAAILGRLGDEAGHAVRAFHPAGQADTEGFIAMGCDEILIHSYDVASGLGAEFKADDDLAARLIARLFPWAPSGYPTWDTLLWCNGRAALGVHDRLGADWSWECAPLSEWDGTVRTRASQ